MSRHIVGMAMPLLAVGIGFPMAAQTILFGDVVVSTESGRLIHYSPGGERRQTAEAGQGEPTGSAFDHAGNLYVTSFGRGDVRKFDAELKSSIVFGSVHGRNPESVVFDSDGSLYVGAAQDESDTSEAQISRFSPTGVLLATYKVARETRGADWLDLARDQRTIYYTSEGTAIKRFDVVAKVQAPDFTRAGTELYAIRILPDGGVLAANSSNVLLFDRAGKIVSKHLDGEAHGLFALNLDPDGVSYWTAEEAARGRVYRVKIASGEVLARFDVGEPVAGLSVRGERTESVSDSDFVPLEEGGGIVIGLCLGKRWWHYRKRRPPTAFGKQDPPHRRRQMADRGLAMRVEGGLFGGDAGAYRLSVRSKERIDSERMI